MKVTSIFAIGDEEDGMSRGGAAWCCSGTCQPIFSDERPFTLLLKFHNANCVVRMRRFLPGDA